MTIEKKNIINNITILIQYNSLHRVAEIATQPVVFHEHGRHKM